MKKSHRILPANFAEQWIPGFRVSIVPNMKNIIRKSKCISKILDLHGITVNEAYIKSDKFIEDHFYNNTDKIIIITGRSGQINEEFLLWISMNKFVRMCKQLPNKGSYEIWLKQ